MCRLWSLTNLVLYSKFPATFFGVAQKAKVDPCRLRGKRGFMLCVSSRKVFSILITTRACFVRTSHTQPQQVKLLPDTQGHNQRNTNCSSQFRRWNAQDNWRAGDTIFETVMSLDKIPTDAEQWNLTLHGRFFFCMWDTRTDEHVHQELHAIHYPSMQLMCVSCCRFYEAWHLNSLSLEDKHVFRRVSRSSIWSQEYVHLKCWLSSLSTWRGRCCLKLNCLQLMLGECRAGLQKHSHTIFLAKNQKIIMLLLSETTYERFLTSPVRNRSFSSRSEVKFGTVIVPFLTPAFGQKTESWEGTGNPGFARSCNISTLFCAACKSEWWRGTSRPGTLRTLESTSPHRSLASGTSSFPLLTSWSVSHLYIFRAYLEIKTALGPRGDINTLCHSGCSIWSLIQLASSGSFTSKWTLHDQQKSTPPKNLERSRMPKALSHSIWFCFAISLATNSKINCIQKCWICCLEPFASKIWKCSVLFFWLLKHR